MRDARGCDSLGSLWKNAMIELSIRMVRRTLRFRKNEDNDIALNAQDVQTEHGAMSGQTSLLAQCLRCASQFVMLAVSRLILEATAARKVSIVTERMPSRFTTSTGTECPKTHSLVSRQMSSL